MNLFYKFAKSVRKYPHKPALVIDGTAYSYQAFYNKIMLTGGRLVKLKQARVGVFASKTLTAYVGLMGAMASGKTYVPMLDEYPIDRNLTIIDQADIGVLVADQGGLAQIKKMKEKLSPNIKIICPEIKAGAIPESLKNKFVVLTKKDIDKPLTKVVEVTPEHLLFISFTSGSTGAAKPVPITHANWLGHYQDLHTTYQIKSTYKVAHSLDLTFSLSMNEFIYPWSVGATVYALSSKELNYQVNYIKKNKINFWIMSPSNAQSLIRFGFLKENQFPHLKTTVFGGEPLSESFIPAWRKAAPNSKIKNGYGSTETQAAVYYLVPENPKDILSHNGMVSIGKILDSLDFCLLDEDGKKTDQQGELCLSGPGVFSGYLNRPKKNAQSFFKREDDSRTWFKTGDRVKYENGHFFHLGRKDFMVKIRGGRVDLEDINFTIKKFSGAQTVYTIAYPVIDGIANYLYVFMDKKGITDKARIFKHLKSKLPFYMLPKSIFLMEDFPLNYHRKIDRKQLLAKIKTIS